MEKLDYIVSINKLMQEKPKETIALVTTTYKNVFSGHPWHEDLVCANILNSSCDMQFTNGDCSKVDINRKTGEEVLTCQGDYASRENIAVLLDDSENCPSCKDPLKLISFYPDFVDHVALFTEAVEKPGFAGYLGVADGTPVCFTWGYTTPEDATKSVRFDLLGDLFEEKGLAREKTFYAAETGVIDVYQDQGFGSVVSLARILDAKEQGAEYLTARTINIAVHAMLERAFSGVKGEFLFNDPERGSQWFAWSLDDLDDAYARRKIERKTK